MSGSRQEASRILFISIICPVVCFGNRYCVPECVLWISLLGDQAYTFGSDSWSFEEKNWMQCVVGGTSPNDCWEALRPAFIISQCIRRLLGGGREWGVLSGSHENLGYSSSRGTAVWRVGMGMCSGLVSLEEIMFCYLFSDSCNPHCIPKESCLTLLYMPFMVAYILSSSS